MMKQAACGFVLLVYLTGCAPPTPPCSDKRTIRLVNRVLTNSLSEATTAISGRSERLLDVVNFEVLAIRTANIDEKVGKYSCEAEAHMKLPDDRTTQVLEFPQFRAILAGAGGPVKVNGGSSLSATIRFTSQLTDDKSEHYVEVFGHEPLLKAGIGFGLVAELISVDSRRPK